MTTTQPLTPAELDALLEAAKAPVIIERLVLMVRELQAQLEWFSSANQLFEGAIVGTPKFTEQAVEHFRARAVRAIDKLYEAPIPHNIDVSLGYSDALEKSKQAIESLPLVEKE